MSRLTDKLGGWGCDVRGALQRCVDDESFYEMLVNMLLDDPSFAGLDKAMAEDDIVAAFEAAHTLKGVLSNLGITPLSELVVKLVEPLRKGTEPHDLGAQYGEFSVKLDEFRSLLSAP